MSLGTIIGALELGSIYAVMALGIYITYKILDFPDLTVDGSFPLGGAVTAAMITSGKNPLLAMLVSLFVGAIAGLATGIIHVKCKIRDLLSGIIVMTGLYSINYLLVGNKANVSIGSKLNTIFSNPLVTKLFGSKTEQAPLHFARSFRKILILLVLLVLIKLLMDLFMNSKRGYLLRAMGDNPMVVATLAKNGGNVKIMGLMVANALVSLSGSLFVQYNNAFNLTDGTGKMVIGLASVIIGVNIFGRIRFLRSTTAVGIGAIVYTACVTLALSKFDAQIMKLVTAVLFLLVLVLGQVNVGSIRLFPDNAKKGKSEKIGKEESET